jgi:hypothetical protein
VHALVGEKFVTLRIPYPLGFYAKGLEGRIDDPNAGWKGRGLWVTSGDRTPWHMELQRIYYAAINEGFGCIHLGLLGMGIAH